MEMLGSVADSATKNGAVATVKSKGRLTLPAAVREEFGIEPGQKVVVYKTLDGHLGVSVIKPRKGAGFGLLRRYAERLEEDKVDNLIQHAIDEAIAVSATRSP